MAFNSLTNGENVKMSSTSPTTALDSTLPPAPCRVVNVEYDATSFLTPIIQTMHNGVLQQSNAMQLLFASDSDSSTVADINHERIRKSRWVSDYAKDIYKTLRESELNRYLIHFQSPQIGYRPTLLELLKIATQTHKLGRTTLHLAIYFVDCFMDHYAILDDKLKLIAISFLILAAKMEEADVNVPKFADLNKLIGDNYYMCEFKHMEKKALRLFNFNLMHPTIVTFAELFSNSIITVDDCHFNIGNFQGGDMTLQSSSSFPSSTLTSAEQYNGSEEQSIRTTKNIPYAMMSDILNYCPRNNDFVEMRTNVIETFFELIDLTFMYENLINIKPSIMAASCIAAVREIHGIHPIWNQRLINLTEYAENTIMPFSEAILTIYHLQKTKTGIILCVPQTPTSVNTNNDNYSNCTFCDSPDSGIALGTDIKYYSADNDSFPISIIQIESNSNVIQIENNNNSNNHNEAVDNNDNDEDDESYRCLEYPLLVKRRRME